MPPEQNNNGQQQQPDDLDARIEAILNSKLNPAITSHLNRFSEKLSKTLDDKLSRLVPQTAAGENGGGNGEQTSTAPQGAGGGAGHQPGNAASALTADPQFQVVMSRVNKLTADLEKERTQRVALETEQKRTTLRGKLAEALDGKGIKGLRAQALISHWEQTGALKTGDDGVTRLAVKRARAKGATAEELLYDDFDDAVDDWSQSTEAQDFVPVIDGGGKGGAGKRGTASGQPAGTAAAPRVAERRGAGARREAPRYEGPAKSAQEAVRRSVAQLEANDVDFSNLAELLSTD